MRVGSEDLHGSAPDKSAAALLLIDVINDFDFEQGEELLRLALPVGRKIAQLKRRTKDAGIPSIYVNDNFGRWQSDFKKIVAHCRHEHSRGKSFVELLVPDEDDDYFVLKPKHSGFYSTTLDLLLTHLGARNLILTGIAGNNCVLFTANDAYMRDFKLFVPSDCVVSNTEEENKHALTQMETVLKADVRVASELDLKAMSS
jgi:nicotinamidase-related amidase